MLKEGINFDTLVLRRKDTMGAVNLDTRSIRRIMPDSESLLILERGSSIDLTPKMLLIVFEDLQNMNRNLYYGMGLRTLIHGTKMIFLTNRIPKTIERGEK